MGDCMNCSWYQDGLCRNPDSDYMEEVDPRDSCTLWELEDSIHFTCTKAEVQKELDRIREKMLRKIENYVKDAIL